jgi:signal transduction histidine kinase/ABC-type uncharacterized transport system substrate-binding protein
MYIIGILSFTEEFIDEVPEIEQELHNLGYVVHLEQMGNKIQTLSPGDFYYEEEAIILWLCRCFGDRRRCEKAVESFIESEVNAIVAINRPALDIALHRMENINIPIIFTHITREPNVVNELEQLQKEGRVTGVWDTWLDIAEERLSLIAELVPTPEIVHGIYNPNIPAVDIEAHILLEAAKKLNIKLILHEAYTSDEVKEKIANLNIHQNHAILRLADPTTIQAASFMGAVAHEQNIPYVGLTFDELERCGALFALEMKGIGKLVAGMISRILKNEPLASISFALPEKKELAVNLEVAKDLGLIISPAILSKSNTIIPAQESNRLGTQFVGSAVLVLLALSLIISLTGQLDFQYQLALIIGFTLLMISGMWIFLNNRLISPLRKLTIAAEKIGSGDLETLIDDLKTCDELNTLARALRRMRNNLRTTYANLDQLNANLKEQVVELTEAYKTLKKTQQELEIASRRIIEAEDNQRFALTTYIHDEIMRPLDNIYIIANELNQPELIRLTEELENRIRQVRFDLSVPIIQDIRIELRRLIHETLPRLYPDASNIDIQLNLDALYQYQIVDHSYVFLIYRFVSGAIINAYRHSQATQINVTADILDNQLSLMVLDNGKGFDPTLIESFINTGHYFFHDIEIRSRQLGGSFLINSEPEKGTCLKITLPLKTNLKKRKPSLPLRGIGGFENPVRR